MSLTLVIGGTRSGKSARAEAIASASGLPVRYLATADEDDATMTRRIAAHRARRPAEWQTVLAGSDPGAVVRPGATTLFDGLGVWLAGALQRGVDVDGVIGRLCMAGGADEITLIVVAEQAGDGLVPLDPVARAWIDALGSATQRLAARADHVELVVAGRPLRLSPPAAPELAAHSAAAPRTRGGAPRERLAALRTHGDTMVRPGDRDHAVNVLTAGPPPWLADALRSALETDTSRYPDARPAARALATLHGRDAEEIVVTNGASEALWLLAPALRPRRAAILSPAFTETELGFTAHGLPVTRVVRRPESGFAIDPDAVPADADLVVAANPGSPDGTLHSTAELLALRRPGRTLVIDEAFLTMTAGPPDTLGAARHPDVIVVRSLTKLLSIPGLRAGYAIAPPALADALRAAQPPWSANALALAAIVAAVAHPAELAALARRASAEGDDLARRLMDVPGIRAWPAAANFVLIEVPGGEAVAARLRQRGIAIRPAGSFPGLGDDHLRLTARDAAANTALVAALVESLAQAPVIA